MLNGFAGTGVAGILANLGVKGMGRVLLFWKKGDQRVSHSAFPDGCIVFCNADMIVFNIKQCSSRRGYARYLQVEQVAEQEGEYISLSVLSIQRNDVQLIQSFLEVLSPIGVWLIPNWGGDRTFPAPDPCCQWWKGTASPFSEEAIQ